MATNRDVYIGKNIPSWFLKLSKVVGWKGQKQMSLCIGFLDKIDFVIGLQDGQLTVV